jgi:hypothetical protein
MRSGRFLSEMNGLTLRKVNELRESISVIRMCQAKKRKRWLKKFKSKGKLVRVIKNINRKLRN